MLLREVERFRDVPGAFLPPKSAHSVPGVVAAGAASAATRSAPPITSTTTTKGGSRADAADSATDASNVSRSGVSTSVAIGAKHNPDTAGTERWNSPRLVAHATNAASTGTFVSLPLAVAASEVQSQVSLAAQCTSSVNMPCRGRTVIKSYKLRPCRDLAADAGTQANSCSGSSAAKRCLRLIANGKAHRAARSESRSGQHGVVHQSVRAARGASELIRGCRLKW